MGQSLTVLRFTFCALYKFCTLCLYYVYIETAGPLHKHGEEQCSRRTSEGDPYRPPEALTVTHYTLSPKQWYLKAEPLGSSGVGVPMNGVRALVKETLESSGPSSCHVRTQQEVGSLQPSRERSPEPDL